MNGNSQFRLSKYPNFSSEHGTKKHPPALATDEKNDLPDTIEIPRKKKRLRRAVRFSAKPFINPGGKDMSGG